MLINDQLLIEMMALETFHFGATQTEMLDGLLFYLEEKYPSLELSENDLTFNIQDMTCIISKNMLKQLNTIYPETLL